MDETKTIASDTFFIKRGAMPTASMLNYSDKSLLVQIAGLLLFCNRHMKKT